MKELYCPRCKSELKIPEEEGIIFSGNCPYCYDCRDGLITQLLPKKMSKETIDKTIALFKNLNDEQKDQVNNLMQSLLNCTDSMLQVLLELNEVPLSTGIFWVIPEAEEDNKLIAFKLCCDRQGVCEPSFIGPEFNSKNGKSYNHKKIWEEVIKNNNSHKPYNKKDYNYYPRGRVEIAHDKAVIYLNPNINEVPVLDKIRNEFGLFSHNIKEIEVKCDGSEHYRCFLDWENYETF